jgi:hypothetical protein
MSFRQKAGKEMREVAVLTLCFFIWFGVLILLRRLYLAEYEIQFRGLSLALVGALVVAKVVLVLEHVPLGQWVRQHAAAIDVILRTLLYTLGVFVAILLERGFEARHEHGGFGAAVVWVFQHRDFHHVWADALGVGCALLAFNVLAVVRRHLGEGRLHRLFLSPLPGELRAEADSGRTGEHSVNRETQARRSTRPAEGNERGSA